MDEESARRSAASAWPEEVKISMNSVFVFQGAKCRFANAVFSTKSTAESWIAKHSLTGLLTEYEADNPAFDQRLKEGTLPKGIREALKREKSSASVIETYVDGARHSHYYPGIGQESPEFRNAMERWHRVCSEDES